VSAFPTGTAAPSRRRSPATGARYTFQMAALRRICCPVDFSEASRRALFHAAALAAESHAQLNIVHVEEGGPTSQVVFAPPAPFQRRASRCTDLEACVREADVVAPGLSVPVLLSGPPGESIARFAREMGVDLIVLGGGRRPLLTRLLRESVVEEVLDLASCPVLVVPLRA
jgi:universal stress protein A